MSVLRTLVSSSRALITGAKEVARFREIARVFVRHGFGWVFAQLKLRRELQPDLEGVDLTRAALASPDTGKRLVAALTELGPTFVKLGQILSTRTDLLPESIIAELTTLQSNVEPLPFSEIEGQLIKTLGKDYRELFATFEEEPLASASIAQVHRATLEGAAEGEDGPMVALKIQRPGVRPKIESDLGILYAIAGWVEEAIDEAQAMDLRGIITDFTKSISQELDFKIEARNLERFERNFSELPHVVFPKVWSELSSTEVLCMEFLPGRKFSEVIAAGESTDEVVKVYFDAAYKMLFHDGFFHGDLHPGNVLMLPDGRLGVLDCGMVGRLSPAMRDKLIDILWAVLNEDLEAVARSFWALSIRHGHVDYQAFEADVIEIAERYIVGLPLSEIQIGTLFGEIVAGATKHQVRMPTDFTMMFKAIITTEGMAKAIAPDLDPVELARPYIEQMVTQRYTPERLKQQLMTDFGVFSRMFRSLPNSLPDLIEEIRAGKVALGVAPKTLRAWQEATDARSRRAVRAALTIACLACGTYSLGLGLPVWGLVGIPALSAAFFFAAGVGAFSLWR
ncbi:ABC1 kinase family protein [Paraliomyxa miuraensis]|uniref:ABC1 kinase family protein n=1 Tax=Paraliomyxa miuraensis TaxID=376150 RepID=UPI002256ED74|nr:AarF/UbiB family protein [Paraliomyxa miuraensis]MCX4245346.1 AarF/UbiB family protein [Paraliomyxa miuraensis]